MKYYYYYVLVNGKTKTRYPNVVSQLLMNQHYNISEYYKQLSIYDIQNGKKLRIYRPEEI